MKILFKFIFFFLLFTNISNADLIKPNANLKPFEVLMIQLNSLKNNNSPYKDAGIEQTWEFAHPSNKKYTGPLEKFKILLRSDSYKMLLNHIYHNIVEVKTTDTKASYEVTILGEGKNYYKYIFCLHVLLIHFHLNGDSFLKLLI